MKYTYSITEIIQSDVEQVNSQGKYIPARWLLWDDGSLFTRLKGAWQVLTGKCYPLTWD
jgi:hypothetical protein